MEKVQIEVDLSRFVSGNAYVLTRTITNPKIDRRMRRGGSDLSAHSELPEGLRFVLDVIETREHPRRDHADVIQVERKYAFTADGGHRFRYFRLEARDVRRFVGEQLLSHLVYVTPHAEYSEEHHAVVLEAIGALGPEPVSLESLAARIDEFHENGWTVIEDLMRRGFVSLANVEASVNALIAKQHNERQESIREREGS